MHNEESIEQTANESRRNDRTRITLSADIEILIHWRILRYTANSLRKLKEYQTVCIASKCVPTNYLQISKAGIKTYCDVLANSILIM